MSKKPWYSRLGDFITAPFRAGKEYADKRPPARKIRKHGTIVRVEATESEIDIVIPKADPQFRKIARVDVDGIKGKSEESKLMREVWATGANWGIAYMATLRRSEINPAIKIYKTAVKLDKAKAKAHHEESEARKEETEAIKKDPSSGIQAIPPTLLHARGRAGNKGEDTLGAAAAAPA